MSNRSEQLVILHISPQPAEMVEAIEIVSEKLIREFRCVVQDHHKLALETVVPSGESLPEPTDLDKFDGLVISGSIYSVYDQIEWLQQLQNLTRSAIDRKLPTLGICFGHQAIVDALGGSVQKGDQGSKIGVFPMKKTETGKNDPLLSRVDDEFSATSWHGDVVTTMPEQFEDLKVEQLVEGDDYPIQAFSIGDATRTTQFHPEFDPYTFSKIRQVSRPPSYKMGSKYALANMKRNGSQILSNFIEKFVLINK